MSELAAWGPLVLVGLVVTAAAWWSWHHRKQLREAVFALAERDGLRVSRAPLDRDAAAWAGRSPATPRGDRRFGLEHAVSGPAQVTLADGDEVTVELAAWRWWYEERVYDRDRRRYRRRTCTVAAARLPWTVPGSVEVRSEGMFGRLGLHRAGDQLESEQFNRRFRVTGSDPTLTVRLLDARMQHQLLAAGTGRSLAVDREVMVLGGSPTHRDPAWPRAVGELPAARRELTALLRACPAAFWRAARRSGEGR